jgi:hypothetical protein
VGRLVALFGRPRREESIETPCPEWAKDYLLSGKVPARETVEHRELSHGLWGEDENGHAIMFLGLERLWLKHKAELLKEWKRMGRRGEPFGARFERDDYPDFETIEPDPRIMLRTKA